MNLKLYNADMQFEPVPVIWIYPNPWISAVKTDTWSFTRQRLIQNHCHTQTCSRDAGTQHVSLPDAATRHT